MGNKSSVTELRIIDEAKSIFDVGAEYVIPLYQRAFAWEEKQLIQLIDDIYYVDENADYYIGSLIVCKQDEIYEVVDGQQRLTALFLLLQSLEVNIENSLKFACRDKSNYTLNNISNIAKNYVDKYDADLVEGSLLEGIRIILQKINGKDDKGHAFDKNKLKENLKRVILYRIEVPENTDLNRYFEIMNVRGEQLEQHDILKAKLLNFLRYEQKSEREIFAKIWDACSDMTGYVQMHFTSKENVLRDKIFGKSWNKIPSVKWNDYSDAVKDTEETNGCKIQEIIMTGFKVSNSDGVTVEGVETKFESIIEFPFFLIHVLKAFVKLNGITHHNENEKIVDDLIDDKKLLASFDRVLNYGVNADGKGLDKNSFSKSFVMYLLRSRYLFDKYIIKREYVNDSVDGKWSLKSLYVSGNGTSRKPYYKNTVFEEAKSEKDNVGALFYMILMLQSALRVSYTSPKVMHWITNLLVCLSEFCIVRMGTGYPNCSMENIDAKEYFDRVNGFVVGELRDVFFNKCTNGVYEMGVHTPRVVFNYLDFILWCHNYRLYKDFVFEFRNSVEHWYPQHPSEGSFQSWKQGVDRFGNLCLVHRDVNSKFSNLSPEAKKSTYKEMIAKGSIKLRIMSEKTGNSVDWKDSHCKEHENAMIDILKKACEV